MAFCMDRTGPGVINDTEPPSPKEDGSLAVPSNPRFDTVNAPTTLAPGGAAWTAGLDTPSGPRLLGAAAKQNPIPVLFPPTVSSRSFTVHPAHGTFPLVPVCSAFSVAEQGLLNPVPPSTVTCPSAAATSTARTVEASLPAERGGYDFLSAREIKREIDRLSELHQRMTGAKPKRRPLQPELGPPDGLVPSGKGTAKKASVVDADRVSMCTVVSSITPGPIMSHAQIQSGGGGLYGQEFGVGAGNLLVAPPLVLVMLQVFPRSKLLGF